MSIGQWPVQRRGIWRTTSVRSCNQTRNRTLNHVWWIWITSLHYTEKGAFCPPQVYYTICQVLILWESRERLQTHAKHTKNAETLLNSIIVSCLLSQLAAQTGMVKEYRVRKSSSQPFTSPASTNNYVTASRHARGEPVLRIARVKATRVISAIPF